MDYPIIKEPKNAVVKDKPSNMAAPKAAPPVIVREAVLPRSTKSLE